jgi:hypothetical protein
MTTSCKRRELQRKTFNERVGALGTNGQSSLDGFILCKSSVSCLIIAVLYADSDNKVQVYKWERCSYSCCRTSHMAA